MTNPDEATDTPDCSTDVPLQPTGSGVADLEIAFEQMKVAESHGVVPERDGDDTVGSSAGSSAGEAESEAHPG